MHDAIHPRPQQVDTLTDLARAFALHDRAQLLIACGTGRNQRVPSLAELRHDDTVRRHGQAS